MRKEVFPTRNPYLRLLSEHYSLLAILVGSFLVTVSLGPYYNWDALLEYDAASGTTKWGLPYIDHGDLINQPPLGYYIDALIFKIFGLSYETGVTVITLFGLGCVLLVYEIGKIFYGKRTGLVAAALFSLTPWYVVMSRIFLIDTQCLFFSLLCLFVGLRAMHKQSMKLLFVSGALFGLALLTKAFAIFMLVPLSLFYVYWRPKSLKRILGGIVLFFLPAVLLHYLWYDIISGQGTFFILRHDDFSGYFPEGVVPSQFFLLHFFISNLGLLLLATCAFSLLLSLLKGRKLFAKVSVSDLVWLATIISVASFNMFLVLAKNLWVPYNNPVKYDYQILPAFCWVAASLTDKCWLFHGRENFKGKRHKLILIVTIIGLVLLMASMLLGMVTLNTLAGKDYFLFMVEGDIGYPFFQKTSPIAGNSWLLLVAFAFITLGLFLFNLDKLKSLAHRYRIRM